MTYERQLLLAATAKRVKVLHEVFRRLSILRRLDDGLGRKRLDLLSRDAGMRARFDLLLVETRIRERLEPGLEQRAVGVDAPQPEAAVGAGRVQKDRRRHHQIDPVGRRHQVHEPREIFVRQLRLAAGEELARLVGQWGAVLRLRRGRRVHANEIGKLLAQQHQEGDPLRAVHARVGHDERVDLRDELVGCRDRFGDVVITCGNATQAQPLVSRHQAFDVRRSDDLEVVLVGQRADHLGVLVHDEGGEVELTVPDKRRLLFEIVIGRPQAEAAEVGILQQLLHQIGRARTFGTDPDRSAFEVVESVDCASAPGEQEQRFRLRQPPQGLQGRRPPASAIHPARTRRRGRSARFRRRGA